MSNIPLTLTLLSDMRGRLGELPAALSIALPKRKHSNLKNAFQNQCCTCCTSKVHSHIFVVLHTGPLPEGGGFQTNAERLQAEPFFPPDSRNNSAQQDRVTSFVRQKSSGKSEKFKNSEKSDGLFLYFFISCLSKV